jgi:hypothetical protein
VHDGRRVRPDESALIPVRARGLLNGVAAAIGFAVVACAVTWPLPLHLRTHLLGDPSGDTGVYVWNVWIFRHELLRHAHLPFSTDHIFPYTGGADFSLHNYAPVAGALGAPFIGILGVVGAFNVVVIAAAVLTGIAMFLLARRLGLRPAAAWIGAALFIASPSLVSRDAVHFSLTMTAALPLFLWALLRTLDTRRAGDAVLAGAAVALASYSDAYFGIFAVLMGAFVVAWRFTTVRWNSGDPRWRRLGRVFDAAVALVSALIVWRLVHGPSRVAAGPVVIRLTTLYTPMLVLLACALARAWVSWHPVPTLRTPPEGWRTWMRLGLVAIAACVLLLMPLLIGIGQRFVRGTMPTEGIFWRSSPRGVDLFSYMVPNPNHPWFGDRTRYWLMPTGLDAYPEYVASFSLVALLVIAVAVRRESLPRMWIGFTVFFVLLSLGPFVHVAGVNTALIGPWALLRFVPVIGLVRSPGRFAIVAVLGMSLLFAFALEALLQRRRHGRTAGATALAVAVGIALAAELAPVPRQLYSAAIPPVYRTLGEGGEESGRLLELPAGARDGTWSRGDFSAATQYYQTAHRRPVIGGYLSRVSEWRRRRHEDVPMLRALFTLSEGKPIPPNWREQAVQSRDVFLRESCIEFVIVHRARAPAGLEPFAVEALRLEQVSVDDEYAMYTPVDRPPCARPPRPVRR